MKTDSDRWPLIGWAAAPGHLIVELRVAEIVAPDSRRSACAPGMPKSFADAHLTFHPREGHGSKLKFSKSSFNRMKHT
jgi:hypothetical protein